jgi:hypothetical protein
MIGISLPIADQSYDVGHEAQLWEEVDTDLMFTEKHAEQMYTWLRDRFASRSMHQLLPAGMPESGESFTIQRWKDRKAGYILFTPQSMIATAMAESETQVMVEYDNGYIREVIGNACTIQILYDDFMTLTQNTWEIYPAVAYRRLSDGTIVHNCTRDYRAGQLLRAEGIPVVHPPRIIEDRGRGSEIHSREDQGKLLQYWAWAQLPMDVGVIFPTKDGRTYEFWMAFRLHPRQMMMVIRDSTSA